MPLDLTTEQWIHRLSRLHNVEQADLSRMDDYYEGHQKLSYMHPQLLREMGPRLRQVVINWPRLVVDSLEERLDVEGFRFHGDDDADDSLWGVWQYNDLDEWSQQGHLEALSMRRSYAIVGSNDQDAEFPLVTVESPLQMFAELDPRTRAVRAALKRWTDRDGLFDLDRQNDTDPGLFDHATLYLPNETVWLRRGGGSGWQVEDSDEHGLGVVPVVPLVNRGRLLQPYGVSELSDVIPVSDAASKIATDMMVSAEFHAMPRRYALGFDESDFQDEAGNPLSTWEQIAGRVWRTARTKDQGVEVGQFPEADLRNFHETLNQLARLVASLTGLPPHYLGFTTDNPASAEAILSSEARLVKRAERRQRSFGGSWEQVMRLVLRIRDGVWDPQAKRLETLWREASTPTFAQKADAVRKLVGDRPILPVEGAWEDLGYSAGRQNRLREMRQRDADFEPLSILSRQDQNGQAEVSEST